MQTNGCIVVYDASCTNPGGSTPVADRIVTQLRSEHFSLQNLEDLTVVWASLEVSEPDSVRDRHGETGALSRPDCDIAQPIAPY